MTGRIHSIETLGALDGPGTRCVVFLQGCPLRCRYCHNPDTWDVRGGTEMSVGEVVARVSRCRPYFGDAGGLTLSGGEPLAQAHFCTEVLSACRDRKIHTALDTAGGPRTPTVQGAVALADLVLLDVKHTDPSAYRDLTGASLALTLAFLDHLTAIGKPFWVRQVIVPGITDSPAQVAALARLLTGRPSLQRVELLPYHSMARSKWAALNRPYPLAGTPDLPAAALPALEAILAAHGLPVCENEPDPEKIADGGSPIADGESRVADAADACANVPTV